ncbi:2-oxo acid dehydrogenase subunit E2, partial [Streptomyces sp. SID7499]|nr:2-oxo acid dehydrogenase subunit E2 [Streptomyces sp. SID7499]
PLLTVAVGAPEGLDPSGASPSSADTSASGTSAADTSASDTATESSGGSGNVLVGYGTGAPAARRRRIRPDRLDRTVVQNSVSDAPVADAPVAEALVLAPATSGTAPATAATDTAPAAGTGVGVVNGQGPVPVVSPLVRRLARQHDIDLRRLAGSGPDGLILRADVDVAIRQAEET